MDAVTDRSDIRAEDDLARDDKALRLRAGGRSFVAVAKALGYGRTHQANDAFNRGLRRQELARLNILAEDVRASQQLEPDDVARRLRTVERLRVMLLAE